MKQKIVVLSIIVLLLALAVTAHKDPTESMLETGLYGVTFGLQPSSIVVNNNQAFFLKVEESASKSPVKGLTADFTIKKTNTDTEKKLRATESNPGYYEVIHLFEEKGSYSITVKLYNKDDLITTVEKEVHVEPNGPSLAFWLFMLTAVIIGAVLASKSDKF